MTAEAASAPPKQPRFRWGRWLKISLVLTFIYLALFPDQGTYHRVGEGKYIEVFDAERIFSWDNVDGKRVYLNLVFFSAMSGIRDTGVMHREEALLLPYADSLAASSHDTLIRFEHRRYPISRYLPLRISVSEYYHHDRDGVWRRGLRAPTPDH